MELLEVQAPAASNAALRAQALFALMENFDGHRRESVGADSVVAITGEDGSAALKGKEWFVSVEADAVSGKIVRHWETMPQQNGVGRMRDAEWIDRARKLLEGTFSTLVPRGDEDLAVPWQTHFATYGDIAADGSEKVTTVVGNFVTFARSIKGVDVVGRGSKIEFAFDQAGNLSGITFDWPDLKGTNDRQSAASKAETRSRFEQLTLDPVLGSLIEPGATQCGYYDPGTGERRIGDVLQLACQVHTIHTSFHQNPSEPSGEALEVVAAIEDVVPAGKKMLRSGGWDALDRWLQLAEHPKPSVASHREGLRKLALFD